MEHGEDGTTRIRVERESEWDDEQVALLIAVRGLAAEIGPHGQPMDEAMSPLADPARRQPGGWRYEPHVSVDFAQRALSAAQDARAKKYPDADLSSDVWTLKKVHHT